MKCPFCIKVCSKCKRILVAYKRNFYSHPTCSYGLGNKCKYCNKKSNKEYYQNNKEVVKEKNKQWRENNLDYARERSREWYKNNLDYAREQRKLWGEANPNYQKQWRRENSEHVKQYDKQWREDNSEHKKEYMREWRKDNFDYVKEYNKQKYDKYLKENGLERSEGSYGEQKVRQVLAELNFQFCEQYRFDDCKFKYTLPFDFYIPNLNTIIEYDGGQHFEIVEAWGGIEHLIDNVIRDTIKNDYCRRNNIRLIRIPYWEFDNIETILSDLL